KQDKNSKSKFSDLKKQTEDKKRADARNAEEIKQRAVEEAKQRAAQEARQEAALAEQRRRAESAREAQARRIAFERGLRLETIENIENDDTDGEDLEVRRAAVNALGKHAGTIVVLEPQTGKVLTIVNQDWAIRKSFKPCSTIKLVTGVAGLNENMINADGNIRAQRSPLNLDDALAFSNNTYFQAVGRNLGNSKMIAYARMLGLGQPTGINADDETGGRLPFGNNNARIYSHGDDFEVTPLQLGVMVSTISNGGRVIIPQIPRNKYEKANFRGAMRYQVNLPGNNLQGVIPGMIGAATYGTARRGVDSTLAVAGKTGSCIGNGSWVGLFASVAPIEDPKYAVIVITRGQSERGKYAAAIAGKIYQSLKSRLIGGGDTIAKIPLELRPQTKVNAKTSARLDADEDEDSEDNDAVAIVPKEVIAPKPAPTTNLKKSELPAEAFPTIVVKVKKSDEPTRPRVVPSNPRVMSNK
ncbi:MAG TPA: penicillin-binding transpeptidase domain-containing protein, partial [Pyrinomonadaceae bacterium]|nr:penicillin-binding transpeptidase domain-containing protein [Pyrinomonadaceae bacterium]